MSLCMRLNARLEKPFYLYSRVEMEAENLHMQNVLQKSLQRSEEGQIRLVIAAY